MTVQNPTSKPMKFVILVVIPVLAALAFYFGLNSVKPEIYVDDFPPPSIEQLNNTLVSGTEVRTMVQTNDKLTFVIYTEGSLLEGDCAVVVGPTLWTDEEIQTEKHVAFISTETLMGTLTLTDDVYVTDRTQSENCYVNEYLVNCNEATASYYVKHTDKYACTLIKNNDTVIGVVLKLYNNEVGAEQK